jgi:ATP-binding cassette subfamily B protein
VQITAGTLTTGELIAFIGYLTQISLSLGVLANLIVIFTKAQASAVRINEALDETPDVINKAENADEIHTNDIHTHAHAVPTNPPGNAMIEYTIDTAVRGGPVRGGPVRGGLRVQTRATEKVPLLQFDGVSFRFPDGQNSALTDVNFTLGKGETLGIIGFTGSGKSALVGLIPRFFDTTEGSVFLDGKDVRDFDLKALRETVRVIPQKSMLFSGTLADNLRFGHKNASYDDCKAALDAACMGDFDPDNPVSAGGKNFSGGQRQRLCIARAIIQETPPQILLADDSFSALDRLTEAKVRANLKNFLPETALIIITERVNFVKNADKILVLEDGRLVGSGTHEELFAQNEHYRSICETQNETE